MLHNIEIDMNKKYWEKFYKKYPEKKPSSFAKFVLPHIEGTLVDLGCGNGRDLMFFLSRKIKAHGVDESFKNKYIVQSPVSKYMKVRKSPENVYTRFFWHAITKKEQLEILKWVKGMIFIEARTTEDRKLAKVFSPHKRNYVNVKSLVKDLKTNGFQILRLEEGYFSPYKGENPHLVRVIAKK